SPEIGAYESAAAGRLFRNHVLGGATIPEHWFGGGGDVNRATGDSMGEPTFKAFSMRQRFLKHMLESVGRYVIRQKLIAETGEPDWWDARLACEAVFPEMTARDTTKYAAALTQVVQAVSMAINAGLMGEETGVALVAAVAGRLGGASDPALERRRGRD